MLKRYPLRKNDPLQAWDAADEWILEHLKSETLSGRRILILNDQFGALACGLKDFSCTVYTDSYVSARGILLNGENRMEPIHELDRLEGTYDWVLIKMPKQLAFFEDLLCRVSAHLNPQSKVIVGAMIKHLPKGAFDLLEQYIGKTTTSLARKKARLIFAPFEKSATTSPYPTEVKIDGFDHAFTHSSHLFSRERLDIGTRFFLEHIPATDARSILDLGCANGIVGIRAKVLNPHAQLTFSDDSFMAIENARMNYRKHAGEKAAAESKFLWLNCFEGQAESLFDLVLCNPPFHQQNVMGDFIAEQMFQDARHSLKQNGIIRVIGNSHLGYPALLRKIFGNARTVATHAKFTVIESIKA